MRDEVARDLSDSVHDFRRVVWPAIEPWCRGGVIESVEAVSPGAFASRAERCHYLAAAWDQLSQDDRQRFLRRAI